ncbi:Trpt1 [Symbiodinium sp. CCMP2592]|nr:Trpt1 [Symbiodinium sp. CCMP2592]
MAEEEGRLMKQMAAFLRHKGLRSMQSDGYALVDDLAKACHADPEDVLEAARTPGKQRFQTLNDGSRFWIRATHGHSLKSVDATKGGLYTEIKNALPLLVHAVAGDSLPIILANGISRNGKPHMLFADSDEEPVLSLGFQDSCNILVYINMAKALFAGIPFSRAPDGMVISPGITERRRRKTEKIGTIPADFILRVVNRYGANREEVWLPGRGKGQGKGKGQGPAGPGAPKQQALPLTGIPNIIAETLDGNADVVLQPMPAAAKDVQQIEAQLRQEQEHTQQRQLQQRQQMLQAQIHQIQQQQQQMQEQVRLAQLLELNQLRLQQSQLQQAQQQMMFQQQQQHHQVMQRNTPTNPPADPNQSRLAMLQEAAQEVHHLTRQLEEATAVLSTQGQGLSQSSMPAAMCGQQAFDSAQMPAMGMSRMGGTDASSRLLVEASGQA